MSTRQDLEGALASWAAGQHEAYEAAETIFNDLIATLRTRFPTLTRSDFELLLGDARRDAENLLDDLITGTVNIDTAVDVTLRFVGED